MRQQFLMAFALFSLTLFCRAAETVRSPDGKAVVTVELKDGRPHGSVAYRGNTIIRNGLLGVETGPENYCGTYTAVGAATARGDSTWKPVWGFLSEVRDRYTEFAFGGDRPVYSSRDHQYGNATIATLKKSEGAVTVDIGGGSFASLTDADRSDFSVVSWCNKKELPGTIVATLHAPAVGAPPFKTSWQAMVIEDTAP
jgi:hypothetical protein